MFFLIHWNYAAVLPFWRSEVMNVEVKLFKQFCHCSFAKQTTRSLTGIASREPNIPELSERQTSNVIAISRLSLN